MGQEHIRTAPNTSTISPAVEPGGGIAQNASSNQGNVGNAPIMNGNNQHEGEGRGKKKTYFQGRGKGIGAAPKGRGSSAPGWTGAGFDVDGRA